MSETRIYSRDDLAKKRMKTYFQFSLIAVMFVVVFAVFYSCQSAKTPKFDFKNVETVQYNLPADDAPVVVFETNQGTFKAVIFPDEAPNFCEYFTGLVNDGYYNDTHIFAVQDEVYFMGGSKTDNGINDSNTDTTQIAQELSPNLWPFNGALISYGDKGGSIFNKKVMAGSRIMFVGSIEFTDEINEQLDSTDGNEKIINGFKEHGGVPNFSQQYTIFGQVYDGYDAYEKICTYDVKGEEDLAPVDEIVLTKVYMSTYGEQKCDEFFMEKATEKTDESVEDSVVDSE